MSRAPHRVAVVVFCEAEGVDATDAAAAAQLAVGHALRAASHNGPDAQEKVGSTREPRCQRCGAGAGVDDAATVRKHAAGEPFYPDQDPENPSWRPEVCPGTGLDPVTDDHPVVGFDQGSDHLPIYARVHEVMEAGMALGNGYLWAGVTSRAFRC